MPTMELNFLSVRVPSIVRNLAPKTLAKSKKPATSGKLKTSTPLGDIMGTLVKIDDWGVENVYLAPNVIIEAGASKSFVITATGILLTDQNPYYLSTISHRFGTPTLTAII